MKWLRVLLPAVLALGLAAPAAAGIPDGTCDPHNPNDPDCPPNHVPPPTLNDSEEPGSVLVFHKFIRGAFGTPNPGFLPATEIEISVTCPKDSQCADQQAVSLRAHWVCPGDEHGACAETTFDLHTTVKGTRFFTPEDLAPPPCRQGYLIVWVIDHEGRPIKFDGLIGDAIIRHSPLDNGENGDLRLVNGIPAALSAGAYNALPIQAAAHLATGDFTDLNGNGDGRLDFDGSEYKAITGTIFGTVRYEERGIQTSLTLLTLDVASNQPNEATSVDLNFFNEQEHLKNASVHFRCWTQVRLTDIDPTLDLINFGRKGLVESTAAHQAGHPVTLVGIVSTIELFELPVEPGVCDQVASTCQNGVATCQQAAATCDATCDQGAATCDATCQPGAAICRVNLRAVCEATTCDSVCPGILCDLCVGGCVIGEAGLVGACTVAQAACTAACTATQGVCTAACTAANGACTVLQEACTVTEGACSVVGATVSVPGLSEYSYSLYNDSRPVPTTFDPGLF